MKRNKGITLVALIVTIIILLILAGISISALTGTGLFSKAQEAAQKQRLAETDEKLKTALEETALDKEGYPTLDEYIEKLIDKEIIIEDEIEKEQENARTVIADDEFVYSIWTDENDNIHIDYQGVAGKLPPIIEVSTITNSTNEIEITVTTKRNDGGKLEYYIKKDGEEKYELKETTTELTYKFTNLEQNQKYNIKVIAIAQNGEQAEVIVDKTTGEMESLTTANTTFTYEPNTWTNGSVKATVSTTVTGYTLQTSTDAKTWSNETSQTFTENGIIYARLYDGTNYGGYSAGNIDKIDKEKPEVTVATATTNSIKIEATDDASGIIGYTVTEDSTEPTSFTSVTNTKSFSTTVTEKTQGKTYYVWVKDEAGNISNYKSTTTGTVTSGTTSGAITFSTATWSNGNASTTISTNTSYTIQYQVNSTTGTWTTGTTVTGLVHGDIVYARLWDGTNGGTYASTNIQDGTKPSATISLSGTSTTTGTAITATVTHTDSQSGIKIASCKWVYNTISSAIGTSASSYVQGTFGGTFSSNPQTITLSTTTAETYYLHVLTTDVAGNVKETISSAVTVEETLANKVQVGDYVKYTPDTASTDSILEELGTYSGSTANTTNTLTQESSLNWRVLDIKDGKVRLISELPTTSKVTLYGAKGYNNAVYLLDKTCSTLYNNSTYAEKVQSLKIEDIQDYLTYDYTQYTNSCVDTGKYGGTRTYTSSGYRYYPNIFAKEKTGWVDGIQGTELDLSEQTSPIDETSTQAGTSIKITQTKWYKEMEETDFTDSIYYNLFITNGSDYPTYWMSSRCVDTISDFADFGVNYVEWGYMVANFLYISYDNSNSAAAPLRPVITLKSDVQIDTTDATKDGTTATNAYVLK